MPIYRSSIGTLPGQSDEPVLLEEGEDYDIVLKKVSNDFSVQVDLDLEEDERGMANKSKPLQVTTATQTKPQVIPSKVLQSTVFNVLDEPLPQSIQPDQSALREAEEKEIEEMKKEVENLKKKLSEKVFNPLSILKDKQTCQFYTAMPFILAAKQFFSLFDDLNIRYHDSIDQKLSREAQILLCLMKLKQDFHRTDLAFRFSVPDETVTNVILTWLHVFHTVFFTRLSDIPRLLKKLEKIDNVIDLTEVLCNSSIDKNLKKVLFDKNKSRVTLKGLLEVSKDGTIHYASRLYPGSISDDELLEVTGVMETLDDDKVEMGIYRRYFMVEIPNPNSDPHIPLGQVKSRQLYPTPGKVSAGFLFQSGINKLKAFTVLRQIPHFLKPFASVVFQTVAALVNVQLAFLYNKENCNERENHNETDIAVQNLPT